ncbi:Gata transcription factor [Thalictrum thalictroides]|uniref:GATA transcription factor n=1 Tax=Thalictrum thalictroides TaxID=46969 RepID=A0A7J6W5S4_THATH|nr:Gata transcription factor [Thalictrum thalictroides]
MEAPELFQMNNNYCNSRTTGNNSHQFTPEKRHSDANKQSDGHFIIEDLLDFSNEDICIGCGDATFDTITTGNSTDSSTVTVVDSCNSSTTFSGSEPHFTTTCDTGSRNNFPDAQFSGELCVPYDDLAELEWLSNFVEDSFSSDDLQKLQLISGMKARTTNEVPEEETRDYQPENNRNNNPIFAADVSVPGKARSKRSRAAPCNWSSRLLVLSPTTSSSEIDISASSNSTGKKTIKAKLKNKEVSDNVAGGGNSDGRRCLHCATDKTPQWRTGPLGPKTLCNACGVRFKSGRLVPEYRPAASPTFQLTQHSNSHRKVLELRRQKEMQRSHQHPQQYMHHNGMFNVSNGDEYLIHHHGGPDYRQLI